MSKIYESKNWLYKKYVVEKLTAQQIGAICGVSHTTIQTWLRKHGIK